MPYRVLVVEDDRDLREMLVQLFTIEGFDAMSAGNGLEALQTLHELAPPHVIVLDLMMPVMDGWTFLRRKVEESALADIPVVIVSALGRERAGDVYGVAVMGKPVDFVRLIATVRECC